MLRRVIPLGRVIAVSLTAIAIGGALLFAFAVDRLLTKPFSDEVGQSMAILANQMQDKLDRGFYERYRELSLASKLLVNSPGDQKRTLENWINNRQRSDTDFIWLALIDLQGDVLASAGQHSGDQDYLMWPGVQNIPLHDVRPSTCLLPRADPRRRSPPVGGRSRRRAGPLAVPPLLQRPARQRR